MCGNPGADSTCFDLLIDHGANENLMDTEGYAPFHYKRQPKLIDMRQIQGLNRCRIYLSRRIFSVDPLDLGDDIDKMIFERNLNGLQEIVFNGDYSKIENRIFPPSSRDLASILANLQVNVQVWPFGNFKMRIEAIHQAVYDSDMATLKQLVDGFNMATCRDEMGRTPLHISIAQNKIHICKYLLLLYPTCVDLLDKVCFLL